MKRNFARFSQQEFDVLVIGGGIQGVWTAYDATRRGLKVALIEKTDWAAGTSSASSKLIHGGIRYLANYEFGLVRGSLMERRLLTKLAPHRVTPLRLALACYDTDRTSTWQLKAGLWLYDRLAGKNQPVPPHVSLSAKKLLAKYPFLNPNGLKKGFMYGDCQEDDARFTLEVAYGAAQHGAAVCNHVKALELLKEGDTVTGARIQDELTGDSADIHAKITINAAGPWSESLLNNPAGKRATRLVKGSHLMMPPLPTQDGMLLTAPQDGRAMFLVPWYGYTILGTTDSDYDGDPDKLVVTDDEIDYMLTAANHVLKTPWTRDDICGRYAGARTLAFEEDKNATAASREWELTEPQPGLIMPIGGKFTTARYDASLIVDRIFKNLGQTAPECTTDRRPLPWAPLGNFDAWLHNATQTGISLGMDDTTARQAAQRHGIGIDALHRRISQRPKLAQRIHENAAFCWGEILHAIDYEMAETLEDILRRRLPITLLVSPDELPLDEIKQLVQHEFGWDDNRCQLRSQ